MSIIFNLVLVTMETSFVSQTFPLAQSVLWSGASRRGYPEEMGQLQVLLDSRL